MTIHRQLSLPLVAIALLSPTIARSQLIPDTTTGTQVTLDANDPNLDRIEGGLLSTDGANLFHSFEIFSIEAGRTAQFEIPDTLSTVFTRVTGSGVSAIDGTLQVGDLGATADLFLLNPNGIEFGADSRTLVGGDLVLTTADSILFNDELEFSASDPSINSGLLAVNVPTGLQLGANPGAIVNRSRSTNSLVRLGVTGPNSGETGRDPLGISTRLGQSLQIVGGDILVDGGRFSAIDGSLSLLALGAGTTARLRRNDNGYIAQPIRPVTITDAGTIHLENGALLSASGHWQGTFERDDPGGASGGIQIYADNFNLQDSIVKADTSSGIGHDSVINANHLLISGLLDPSQIPGTGGISRNAGIYINAYAVGQSGDLYLNSETLQIERSGIISMDAGNDLSIGGNLWIVANDSIMIGSTDTFVSEFPNNFSVITATLQPGEAPQGGTINIATERLTIANDGRIEIGNQAPSGNPGEIIINADTINIIKRFDSDPILNSFSPIAQGASIETGASSGQSGSIRINSQALTLDGLFAAIVIGSGDGTNTLDINSDDISITNGAQIVSITESDRSAADLRITSQNIELQGTSENGDIPSLIGTQTRAASFNFQESQTNGNAGVLDIRTARLLVEDGAAISVDTFANGNAGELIINSGDTIISGQSDIASETTNVAQIDQFRISPVRNVEGFLPSRITGFTSGAGSGGSVSIVGDRLTVRDGARIEVGANRFQLPVTSLGDAGNLQLTADRLSLENGQLLANTESGNTGNIAIASQDLRLRDTSEIRTNATGNSTGGNITIRADTIIALENSDITADAPLNRGGQIRITAIGILGAALRAQATPFTSDITATSGLGPEFDGVVLLETPNIAIGNGLVDPKLIAAPPLLQNACETQPGERPSEFHIIGRGGLPGTAEQIAELPDLFAYHESRQASPPHLEAHRLQRNRDGMAILLAHQIPLTVPCSLSQQN